MHREACKDSVTPTPIKGWKIATPCRRWLKEMGPTATYEDMAERLAGEGIVLSRDCYERHYRNIYKQDPPTSPQVLSPALRESSTALGGPTAQQATSLSKVLEEVGEQLGKPRYHNRESDHLRDFLRFCLAVEAVGGVWKARKLLDLIERLGSVMNCTTKKAEEESK